MLRLPATALVAGFFLLLNTATVNAGPGEDWARITALDAGPQGSLRTKAEVQAAAVAHLGQQERALRDFLTAHASDERTFEARLRLARLLQIRADFEGAERLRAESRKLLETLALNATPAQRTELDFVRLTMLMRSRRAAAASHREELLTAARTFQSAHPGDRRVASALVEIASLYDAQPVQKRTILSEGRQLTDNDDLRRRIDDDLKRLDLLGTIPPLRGTTLAGKQWDIAEQQGKVVVAVFFADWSPPSVAAAIDARKALAALPQQKISVVGISLDGKPEAAAAILKQAGATWPVLCDGKGWMGPLVRELGVNTLPAIWLCDPKGRLRVLNAREALASQVQALLGER